MCTCHYPFTGPAADCSERAWREGPGCGERQGRRPRLFAAWRFGRPFGVQESVQPTSPGPLCRTKTKMSTWTALRAQIECVRGNVTRIEWGRRDALPAWNRGLAFGPLDSTGEMQRAHRSLQVRQALHRGCVSAQYVVVCVASVLAIRLPETLIGVVGFAVALAQWNARTTVTGEGAASHCERQRSCRTGARSSESCATTFGTQTRSWGVFATPASLAMTAASGTSLESIVLVLSPAVVSCDRSL